jgi:Leucine-rich repeat (LRR) protein
VAALRRLDLSNNAISEIYAYTFFGSAKLSYLNLEANRLNEMAENAFLGLENTLRELNLKVELVSMKLNHIDVIAWVFP